MHIIRYWLPVMILCSAIFIQSAYPAVGQSPFFWSDKLVHFIVYGLLGALFARAFSAQSRFNGQWMVCFVLGATAATIYGISDEWHQSFVAYRSADWVDAVADAVGSAVGSGAYCRWASRSGLSRCRERGRKAP